MPKVHTNAYSSPLLNLPTEIIQSVLYYLIHPNPSEYWKLLDESLFYRPISIPLENMKATVLKLQSICKFFRNDDSPIGRELNEFWILLMERDFGFPIEFIEKNKKKISRKACRCYALLLKTVEMKYNNDCKRIRKVQNNSQSYFNIKVCVIGEDRAGKSNLTRKCTLDSFFDIFDMGTVEEIYKTQIQIENQVFYFDFDDYYNDDEIPVLKDRGIRDSHVVVIAFPSIHDSDKALDNSLGFLNTELHRILRVKDTESCPCVIAFTKSDLLSDSSSNNCQFDVKTKELLIRKMLRRKVMLDCGIVHTSAKTGDGIDKIMFEIINRFLSVEIPPHRTKQPNYQFWTSETILEKIISNEKEILKIISKEKPSDNCKIM